MKKLRWLSSAVHLQRRVKCQETRPLKKYCCFFFDLEMPNKLKKVYELEGLVCDLHAHFTAASGSTLSISKSKATELLSSTIFDYEPNSRYVWTY